MPITYPNKLSSKKKYILFVIIFLALTIGSMMAQKPQPSVGPKPNIQKYIQQFSAEAINQMVEFKIPASVILAQAIFESGSGTSELALESKNHFGIKCHVEWIGDTIVRHDDKMNECFRKYERVEDSYRDHSLFLVSRKRYDYLFNLSTSDYIAWCYGLKKTGYATYPHYAEDLIRIIEEQKLYELDRVLTLATVNPLSIKNVSVIPDIVISHFNAKLFEIKDFTKEGLIWLDEKDVLVQSIDMILEAPSDEGVAGNP